MLTLGKRQRFYFSVTPVYRIGGLGIPGFLLVSLYAAIKFVILLNKMTFGSGKMDIVKIR